MENMVEIVQVKGKAYHRFENLHVGKERPTIRVDLSPQRSEHRPSRDEPNVSQEHQKNKLKCNTYLPQRKAMQCDAATCSHRINILRTYLYV